MSLRYFNNEIDNVVTQPNDVYRALQQSFIDEEWDNTSAKTPENGGEMYEQASIGSSVYNNIDVWVKAAVGESTTGSKTPEDFLRIIFKDIEHKTTRGLYYQFNQQMWLVTSYTYFNGLAQDATIRRCNNNLRIVDALNGAVVTIPCIVDYAMMSPMLQVSRYVSTPNGHITVITQGSDLTHRLLTLNTRYILDGRPFKLFAYQDTLEASAVTAGQEQSTILYLDLYLDEIHAEDNLTTRVADNGSYNYVVSIDANDMDLTMGSTMVLPTTVKLNGEEVSRGLVWSSTDAEKISVSNGAIEVKGGEIGDIVTITATLSGNANVSDSVKITIADQAEITAVVLTNPVFKTVRQFEEIQFVVQAEYNGTTYTPTTSTVSMSPNSYIELGQRNNGWYVKGLKPSASDITLTLTAHNTSPAFDAQSTIVVKSVSMFG